MAANFMEALLGIHVDTSGLESGLKKAEQIAEEATKAIAGNFALMATGIATVLGATLVAALEKSIKTTAEFGLEMEHLGARMGMTAEQAATLTGVMERYGIGTGVAARSMQIMASEMRQTQEALDPLHTRLGKVLGTLRDSSGAALNMSQTLDLARAKIAGAGTATEQLQLAQQIFGTRMGGQLLPLLKLSNEEWDKQKASVEAALGPVGEASEAALDYKKATAELDQQFKGLELTIGTAILPIFTKIVGATSSAIEGFKKLGSAIKNFASETKDSTQIALDTLHKMLDTAGEKAAAPKAFALGGLTSDELEKYAKAAKQLNQELAAGVKLGIVDAGQRKAALETELAVIRQQIQAQQDLLAGGKGGLNEQQRLEAEAKIAALRVQEVQAIAKDTQEQYQQEELQAKAVGMFNQEFEIRFLQQRLNDARIVGDERLKLEGELFDKQKKYAEEAVKLGVQLGAISVDQEISYRKQRTAELLGRGDVLGAGQEFVKLRDLAIQQADQQMEFVKKLRIVSLTDEINFQRQKLEVVKGNAQEEMKVIGQIADLDKQLYNQRLEYALNYVTNTQSEYDKLVQAQLKGGESLTAADRQRNAARQEVEAGRMAGEVLRGGGSEAQWQASINWAQQQFKLSEQLIQMGRQMSETQKDNLQIAKDVLKAGSMGEEVRAPGGPSPTVGSILSPVEGLATQGLARGTDIPRLDTSFTDLATRLRDVLNTNVNNLVNFGGAVADVTKKISAISGFQINPAAGGATGAGIVGAGVPGTTPQAGGGSQATVAGPPTVGPGGTPTTATPQTGVGPSSGNDQIVSAITALGDKLDDIGSVLNQGQINSTDQINEAIASIRSSRQQLQVTVSADQSTGDLLTTQRLIDSLSS